MKIIRKIRSTRRKKNDEEFYDDLKKLLRFKPKDISIYKVAFIHSSLKKTDESGNPLNYERLEYLGDAMLGAIIASFLYEEVPYANEGYLTQMRSKLVSRRHLNELGMDLNLIRFVKSNVSKNKIGVNIHGNIFEALIGAIYLDRGYLYCKKFITRRVIDIYVDIPQLEGKITSYKSLIVEWCQKQKKKLKFNVYEDSGNEPIKHFSVKLYIDGKLISKGRATSKKKAEEHASRRAYYSFQTEIPKA